jgi:hypothetical protein
MRAWAGRGPWGFVAAAAAVVAVESAVARRGDDLASYQALAVRFAARAAAGEARGCETLALGDSAVKFGFDPSAMSRALGTSAYNLAAPGTPPPVADAILARALRAGARPKAVVVGFLTLAGNPRVSAGDMAEILGPSDCLTLARACRDPSLFAELAAPALLPSVRYRHTLRGRAAASLAGDTSLSPSAGWKSLWSRGLGAELREPGGPAPRDADPGRFETAWQVHGGYEQAFRRLAARASAHGARVFWLVPPLEPSTQARRDSLGLDAPHTRNFLTLLARMPGVVVLDARRAGLSSADFFDPCHLNAAGADRLTSLIAASVRDHLSSPPSDERWVTLAPDDDDAVPRIANGVNPSSKPE